MDENTLQPEHTTHMNRLWTWLDPVKESKLPWWIVVIAGAIFHLRQYLANRAFWGDESSLALNLIHRNYIGLTQPLDFHQAAPVGFLFIVKTFVNIFGNSEYSLRLPSLSAGIISLYVLYRLAREHFGMAGIVAVLFVAGNIWLNSYASELKQYIGDVLFALLLTYLAVRCFSEPANKRDFLHLGIAGILAVWIIVSDIIDCGGCEGNMLDYFADSLNKYGTQLDAIETPTQAGGYLYDLNP